MVLFALGIYTPAVCSWRYIYVKQLQRFVHCQDGEYVNEINCNIFQVTHMNDVIAFF